MSLSEFRQCFAGQGGWERKKKQVAAGDQRQRFKRAIDWEALCWSGWLSLGKFPRIGHEMITGKAMILPPGGGVIISLPEPLPLLPGRRLGLASPVGSYPQARARMPPRWCRGGGRLHARPPAGPRASTYTAPTVCTTYRTRTTTAPAGVARCAAEPMAPAPPGVFYPTYHPRDSLGARIF